MEKNSSQWDFTSQGEDQTFALGNLIGKTLEASTLIGLNGTLGSGKTRLTQGIIAGVTGNEEVVVSPTFTLCIPYEGRVTVWHLDAYRIQDDEEVYELGLDEALDDGCSIVIEWVDKIRGLLPTLDLTIEIEHLSPSQRRLQMIAQTEQGRALLKSIRTFAD